MTKFKAKNILTVCAIGLLTLIVMLTVSYQSMKRTYDETVNDAKVLANLQKERLEHIINDRLTAIRAMESLVIRDNGDIAHFQAIGATILGDDPCVRCIQFAKDGKITPDTIYPYEGNEAGVGDLLSPNSPRYQTALMIKEKRTTVLSIPKDGKLHQGGSGPIIRRAVYITDDEGNESFWGFTVIIMDFPAIFSEAGFDRMERSYLYSVTGVDAEGQTLLLAGEEEISKKALKLDIALPENTWSLSIIPADGWVSTYTAFGYLILTIGLVLLVMSLSVFVLKSGLYFQQYKKLANYDGLSELLNKRVFGDHIQQYVKGKRSFSLYIIDIDRFKAINDTYGHHCGDLLIVEMANRITGALPESSEVFRIGGDEFAAICFDISDAQAEDLMHALVCACNKPFYYDTNTLDISISCGHALYPHDSTKADDLLQLADVYMYQQKGGHSKTFPLSGREHFFRAISYMIKSAKAQGDASVFYFFHIDYKDFKYINFHYGINEGDALIRRTIEHFRKHPNCVLCGRGNADNVFVLVKTKPTTSQEEIRAVFDKCIKELIANEQKNYLGILLSIHCGYSFIREGQLTDAVARANLGRVKARKHSLTYPVFIDEEIASRYMHEKQIEQEVLIAMQDRRIGYHLQPQIDINTGKMVSAEALGRIYKKNGEMISPAVFIPVLEDLGVIVDFDLIVFDMACKDVKKRLDDNKKVVPISVNLSRRHIALETTAQRINDILKKYSLPSELFCFEITEMPMPITSDDIARFCHSLHDIGVKVSLDDLGAGDADISLIKDIHIDELKLDKMFLSGHTDRLARYMDIMKAIVDLAKKLNIRVVCEGVENIGQYEVVKQLGIDLAQGFYYSKPNRQEIIYRQFLAN